MIIYVVILYKIYIYILLYYVCVCWLVSRWGFHSGIIRYYKLYQSQQDWLVQAPESSTHTGLLASGLVALKDYALCIGVSHDLQPEHQHWHHTLASMVN